MRGNSRREVKMRVWWAGERRVNGTKKEGGRRVEVRECERRRR